MAFSHRVVGAHRHRLGIAGVGGLFERDIFRNVDHHGAGTATARDMKRLLQRFGQVANIFHQEIVLDDGTRDAHGVAFLEGVEANRRRGHLASDDHHGHAVHVSGGNASDRIGHAGARGDQGHAHIARGSGIAIGGMHSRLLVAHQHVLNGVLLVKRIVDVENGATRITPEVLDVLSLQGLDKDLRAHELFGCRGSVVRSGCGLKLRLRNFHDEPL